MEEIKKMSLENRGQEILAKFLETGIKTKGLGIISANNLGEVTDNEIGSAPEIKWNLLKEEVSLPAAVLNEKLLRGNVEWMKTFMKSYEIRHCPHGKTTMCPDLFKMQIEDGDAWGISLATAPQVQLAHSFGVRRVLLANQLVGKTNMEIISNIFKNDSEFFFVCIVDSPENVNQLGEFFKSKNQNLKILLEFGTVCGRTGIRTPEDENSVLSAISKWENTLNLVGVEFYEGILKGETEIRAFIQKVISETKSLHQQKKFSSDENSVIISGSGSAWFDIVAEELSTARLELGDSSDLKLEIILRPGCYLTHDKGLYTDIDERIQNRIPVKSLEGKRLLPALQIWAYVQSIPESLLAIIGFGRRDVAFDCGFPIPAAHFRSGWNCPKKASPHWKVTNMMDQHVYLNLNIDNKEQGNKEKDSDSDSLQIGDIVIFDIIHPCTTFDKWKHVLLTDEHFNVVDIYTTYF